MFKVYTVCETHPLSDYYPPYYWINKMHTTELSADKPAYWIHSLLTKKARTNKIHTCNLINFTEYHNSSQFQDCLETFCWNNYTA